MDAFNELSLQEQIRAPRTSVSKLPSDPGVDPATVLDLKPRTSQVSDNQPHILGHLREAIEVGFVGPPLPPHCSQEHVSEG